MLLAVVVFEYPDERKSTRELFGCGPHPPRAAHCPRPLTANIQNVELPDGSSIAGETTYTKSDGTTGTAAVHTIPKGTSFRA